jgi:hypothetical protein
MRGLLRAGVSGANTVMTGLTRPWFVAACRWPAHSAAMSAALDTSRRSRTLRLFQYSRPMQRLLLRHATRAPNSSSSSVCR